MQVAVRRLTGDQALQGLDMRGLCLAAATLEAARTHPSFNEQAKRDERMLVSPGAYQSAGRKGPENEGAIFLLPACGRAA